MAATATDLMIPLVDRMIEQVLGGSIVYTDDTTVTLLTPGEGKGSRASRIWIYVGTEPGRCYCDALVGTGNGGSLATVVLGACPRRQPDAPTPTGSSNVRLPSRHSHACQEVARFSIGRWMP